MKHTFFYNNELRCIIVTENGGSNIGIRRQQATHPEAQWKNDDISSIHCENLTGLKGSKLLESHVSPDGRQIVICTNSLKIYEFKLEEQSNKNKIDDANPQGSSMS